MTTTPKEVPTMTTTRLESIQAGLAEGLSRRAIAARLGISDRLVRRVLAAGSAPADTSPSAAAADYWPPDQRVLPPVVTDGGLSVLPSSPTQAFIRCPGCGHAAWRTAPGRQEWECGCVVGPHGCHGPKLVPDESGVGQIRYGPYLIKRVGAPLVG
jgi:hypothetical protein